MNNETNGHRPANQPASRPANQPANQPEPNSTRRQFIKASASAAVASGVTAGVLGFPRGVHAAGDDLLRVGLIGCGGRGTGAARQALEADDRVKLVAMGDVFEDRLQLSLSSLAKIEEVAGKIDVPPERQFAGFDAYQQVLATDVDVVLLTAPPHFRPMHLKAAVAAGKHVFAEKPVAVDAPGVRSVLETCAEAKRKGLSVVSGLCLRYDAGFRETVQRLHDGAIARRRTRRAVGGIATCERNSSGSSNAPACNPGPGCSTPCGRAAKPNWRRNSRSTL